MRDAALRFHCRFALGSFDRYLTAPCSGALRSRSPPEGFIEPCLPTVADTVPSGRSRVHQIKHDGFRFICRREGNRIRVFSRRGHDWTDRVPRIVDTFARLPATSATLAGEGVACDPNGVTNFELLRAALGRPQARSVPLMPST